jgi:GNAT superfamily N-acetyltransferase
MDGTECVPCLLVTDIEIRPTRFGAPVARALVAAAMADLGARYGGAGDETPVDDVEFDPPNGLFMIAWRQGGPIGCVGWRSHENADEIAELKRMYVTPDARGSGVAAMLLAAVEDAARSQGRVRMILECGDKQPEAVGLYERSGYVRIPDFGFYRDAPGVRSYGRDL